MAVTEMLGPMRHACQGCGSCCQGNQVPLVDDEPTRLEALAAGWGVIEPVDERGMLRRVEGACVFLEADKRCRIHREVGAQAKPYACRQYPLVAIRVAQGNRLGVDPGCLTGWQTWQTGPSPEPMGLRLREAGVPDGVMRLEQATLDLLQREGATVQRVLAALAGQPTPPDGVLHPGFASRLCTRLQALNLPARIDHPDTSWVLRDALGHVADAAACFDPDAPPSTLALTDEQQALALDVASRMVFLRLVPDFPFPPGVALLVLIGAVAIGWVDPTPARFGPALAAWTRLVRIPVNVGPLVPSAAAFRWLLTGQPEADG